MSYTYDPTSPPAETEERTHEPSGVAVTFRRVPSTRRACMMASAEDDFGAVMAQLFLPGVGVADWKGVVTPEGKPVPYNVATYNAVADKIPGFAKWFTRNMVNVSGFVAVMPADDAAAAEADGGNAPSSPGGQTATGATGAPTDSSKTSPATSPAGDGSPKAGSDTSSSS